MSRSHPDYLRIPLAGYLAREFGALDHATAVQLARALELALPGMVKQEYARSWFSRNAPLQAFEVNLEPFLFRVDLKASGGGNLACSRIHVVHGIVLAREELLLGQWLEQLATELEALARRNQQAEAALRQWLDLGV